eukprot:GFYU01024155.1.p1 GENE.GFYU01024155.1~~GFYU01024155.1.p1  ORF type:complete len:313 (+),score=40.31 GFYU01024155.1:69-1007(+)
MLSQASRRLMRSVLFCPADNLGTLTQALTVQADVVVVDLEDSVYKSDHAKSAARDTTLQFLESVVALREASPSTTDHITGGRHSCPEIVLRVNCPLSTAWGVDDTHWFNHHVSGMNAFNTVLVPKVETSQGIDSVCDMLQLPNTESALWVMVETPRGVLESPQIAAHPMVDTLVFGANDLTKELRARHTSTREPLLYSMSRCVLAARASGKHVLDGVHMNPGDSRGLRTSCVQGKNMGFDGKSLIHPDQVHVTNEAFSPSEEEVQRARDVLAEYEAGERDSGSGYVADALAVEHARIVLHEAQQIGQLTHTL